MWLGCQNSYPLSLPVTVTRVGGRFVNFIVHTTEISNRGLLLTTDTEPDVGVALEYTVTLTNHRAKPVVLRCVGHVIRTNRLVREDAGSSLFWMVAVTLERHEFLRVEGDALPLQ
jgi:hypothetical protein